jgi:PAS domain S-box-containing protein
MAVCLQFTQSIGRTGTVEEIYNSALDALRDGLGVSRAAILLVDAAGVMRFKAYRGLSDDYRRAVEGHTPWTPDTPDPQPVVVTDVAADPTLRQWLPVIQREGIAAMAFIPLVARGQLVGKFMLYYEQPHTFKPDELALAGLIGSQVAFAVDRTRAEENARRSEERLRFALDAARMGTWDWDLATQRVCWSDNLERIHGMPAGSFDGTFLSFERGIHPEDRDRVLNAARAAIEQAAAYDVEYRIVADDGTVKWVEAKGRVEYEDGRPVRMTGICMVVTRRKTAELEKLAAAEEASRLKDEFLATLSHELRTPLNAVLGWVQMLQSETGLSTERIERAIDVIGRNARLQAQLIEDILDVSRIVAGKLEIERHALLVPVLVDTVVSGLLPAANARRIQVACHVARDIPPIEGDPKRLQQVLGNVLSNAIKFTPEGGRVELRCDSDEANLTIEIADSGVGIEPAFLPFVFDRFRQADCRSTRTHGGLGLGLAIARHILEQHGGRIQAFSDGPGCGTTIRMNLPVRVAAPAGDEPAVGPDATRRPHLAGATVLVVDDQRDSRELLALLLEECGAQVFESDSAAGALELMMQQPIHLLVADIAMPDVDGYELIARIRQEHGSIPALAVSAYARVEDREMALAAGYNGYCSKPISTAEFLSLADAVLTQFRRERQLLEPAGAGVLRISRT